ncbi:acyl carrier protein [Heyndrickxia sporothermodurans]|uniref:acyl carrier protein n=1 Tax=Heyndrickxia sporothermodurans TaxID=46224 RepID=UPI002E242497|nr:acyl carrier protein [Heyndrickxia sporothermodurans]
MSNLERYNNIFKDIFQVKEIDLNKDFQFQTVEKWDSITHMSLITILEDSFDIFFETEDILNYGSYENGIEILKKYGVSFDE